ncbi:MAG: hypothetical protein KH433_00020 [Campylobacter concisus]|nr:hypothetical protein [Campylobacter concisus]
MRKTGDFVKLKDKSMYFPKVELTYDELYTLYVYGHASPQFLYQVVVCTDMVDRVIHDNCKSRPNKKDGYKYLLDKLKKKIDEVQQDLLLFSKGKTDLIDLSVKYGFYYYDLKKAFLEVLDVDVNEYWKQHKKYVQKHTCLELYGVDSSAKVADIQAKQKATVKAKYGAENIMQTDTGKKHLQKTMMERYGVPCNLMARDDVYDFSKRCYDMLMSDSAWVRVLKKLASDKKVAYDMLYKEYPLYHRDFILSMQVSDHIETLCKAWKKVGRGAIKYPTNTFFKMPVVMASTFLNDDAKKGLISLPSNFNCFKSQYELMVANYLDSLGVKYEVNNRSVLGGKEIDFYIPEKKIGIEINPSVSHNSNKYAKNRGRLFGSKEELYHYDKYKAAEKAGVVLLQLFEYDLNPEQFEKKTKYLLKQKLCGYDEKIYARKTVVYEAKRDARTKCVAFLNEYHLQGSATATKYFAMEYCGELVGVASFKQHKGYVELKRLCFKRGVQVLGGLSKFIKAYFKSDADCDIIKSFSDNNIGDGVGYARAGAELVGEIKTSLCFISPSNGLDVYSWQIATPWSAKSGVLSKYTSQLSAQNEIDEYIETKMPHRFDDGHGYDRVYRVGSKIWQFVR